MKYHIMFNTILCHPRQYSTISTVIPVLATTCIESINLQYDSALYHLRCGQWRWEYRGRGIGGDSFNLMTQYFDLERTAVGRDMSETVHVRMSMNLDIIKLISFIKGPKTVCEYLIKRWQSWSMLATVHSECLDVYLQGSRAVEIVSWETAQLTNSRVWAFIHLIHLPPGTQRQGVFCYILHMWKISTTCISLPYVSGGTISMPARKEVH